METSHKWEQSLKDLEGEFRRLIQALDLIVALDRRIFQTGLDRDALLAEMLNGIRNLIGAQYAQILLRRGPELVVEHSTQPTDKGLAFRIDNCVCGVALSQRRTIASGNILKDFPAHYQWTLGRDGNDADRKMVSEIAVPIYAHLEAGALTGDDSNKIVAGVINIESPEPNAFHSSEIELVEKFALQAGAAINTNRLYNGLALNLKLAEDVQSFWQEPRKALHTALEHVARLFQGGVVVQLLVHDRASDSLIIEASTLEDTEDQSVLVDKSFSGLVIRCNRAVLSNDVRREHPQFFQDTVKDAGHEPSHSELAVPIREDGRIVGILNVESPDNDAFSSYDEYMLTVIAANASIWTRIRKSKRELALEKMATVGNITGHLMHTLSSGLTRLSRIARELKQIGAEGDEALRAKLHDPIRRLEKVAPDITKSVEELQEMYAEARDATKKINVNQLALRAAKELITREDIRIHWELDEGMPNLRVAPGIYHVFWNLLSNSQAAINEGQTGDITVGTRLIEGEYTKQIEAFELWVYDNGNGVAIDELPKISQLTYSSKKGRVTGYGLWWVDTFTDRWEGKMSIESELGRGTKIRIWFPLTPEGGAAQIGEDQEDD